MEELLKEINKSLDVSKKGIEYSYYDYQEKAYVEGKYRPQRGIGTKAYTIRRIQLLEDKLKQLKKDIKDGKYDFKGE